MKILEKQTKIDIINKNKLNICDIKNSIYHKETVFEKYFIIFLQTIC